MRMMSCAAIAAWARAKSKTKSTGMSRHNFHGMSFSSCPNFEALLVLF